MATEYIVVYSPETSIIIDAGTLGPQGIPGDNDSPNFTGPVHFILLGTENILVDARTNPRSITLGVFRIEHTAGMTGTRPISLDIDCNGFSDTHGIDINYIARNLTAGENHAIDFHVDTDNSTGGNISAISVSKTGEGLVDVTAMEVYQGVNVLDQEVGAYLPAESNFTYNSGAYTDRTTAFTSTSTNTQLFIANTDYIYIGHSIKFNTIDIALTVFASGTGIIPTFEYSDGANSWATFSPGDSTNGFRQNGTIAIPSLPNWVTRTVNSIPTKFWIRIRRTATTLITPPTEYTIKIIISTKYYWDLFGNLEISKLIIRNLPTFSNNNAAIAGGLGLDNVYKTLGGSLNIVV